ncbi:MAG: EAL domain-containing protein, partial [Lachnospiraceae bacterium]|nr:EAL domain-containing protein [Lachnospiraceae bacterium]
MELAIAFDAAAFLLCAFCAWHELRKGSKRNKQNKVFFLITANLMLSALVAVTSNVIQQVDSLRTESNRGLLFLALMLYFLIHNLLSSIYVYYIRTLIGMDANTTFVKEVRFFSVGIINTILVLGNLVFGWIFTITADMRYVRGRLVPLLYACSLFYLFLGLYYMVRYRDALTKKTMQALYVYYGIIITGVAIQFLIPQWKVELFFETICLVGFMMTFEEDAALHNPVTGLYNRQAFRQDITRLLTTRQPFFCINISLLNLRFYTRIMNLESYNEMLSGVGAWVQALRGRSLTYFFGDHFTLLLFETDEEEVKKLTEEIRFVMETPWVSGGSEIQFQSFISVFKAPEDVNTIDDVLDLMEYEPDNKGAHVTVQYRESLAYVKREAAVERALRNAVSNRSFQVYYQPIYSCETGTITSAEALVRLFDEELGAVSPGEFIPIAEKSALIVEIGNIVFEKVCRFLQEAKPEQYGIEYTEVNLSVAQFMQSDLVETFSRIIEEYAVKPSQINLEITESVASDSTEPFMLAVRQLENMGFSFSMDDYGTGYSNIASILNVNFTNIKMDKSFLARALDNEQSASILRDTTHLIRHLGRNVLQEGVETRDELNFVQEAGCNLVQGYYFSKPLPEQDFLSFVKSFNRRK